MGWQQGFAALGAGALAIAWSGCGSRTGLSDELSALASSGASGSTGISSLDASSGSTIGSATAATPPSCPAGMPPCEPPVDRPQTADDPSCCASLEVPGGTFFRTYANDGTGASNESDPATVSSFRLDEFLVTVGRFRQYVNYLASDAGAPPPNGSGKHTHLNGGRGLTSSDALGTYETGWDAANENQHIATGLSAAMTWNANLTSFGCDGQSTWTAVATTQEKLPINCISWAEAYAFCIWDGGFLPSEAEWEYAAAGGSQQREYPWGSADPGTASQYAIYGCDYPSGSGSCAGLSNLAPVGTAPRGAGAWGQVDLVGELYEWSFDRFEPSYETPCIDCANLPGSFQRVRGGGFNNAASTLSASFGSIGGTAAMRFLGIGFRCARTP